MFRLSRAVQGTRVWAVAYTDPAGDTGDGLMHRGVLEAIYPNITNTGLSCSVILDNKRGPQWVCIVPAEDVVLIPEVVKTGIVSVGFSTMTGKNALVPDKGITQDFLQTAKAKRVCLRL